MAEKTKAEIIAELDAEFGRLSFDAGDRGRYGQPWTDDTHDQMKNISKQLRVLRQPEPQR